MGTVDEFGIIGPAYGGELRIKSAVEPEKRRQFCPFANFPQATRDVAVTADSSIPAEKIRMRTKQILCEVCGDGVSPGAVRIFDVYGDEFEGGGSRSIALRLTFGRSDGTLSEDEVGAIFDALVGRLEVEFAVRRHGSPSNSTVTV
jgi:phenylalanyl-tRNA synthetase beta subunit